MAAADEGEFWVGFFECFGEGGVSKGGEVFEAEEAVLGLLGVGAEAEMKGRETGRCGGDRCDGARDGQTAEAEGGEDGRDGNELDGEAGLEVCECHPVEQLDQEEDCEEPDDAVAPEGDGDEDCEGEEEVAELPMGKDGVIGCLKSGMEGLL